MADEDDQEKTEEPTQKRIRDAVQKGQVAFSREVTNFLILVLLALNIVWFAPYYAPKILSSLSRFIAAPHEILLDQGQFSLLAKETIGDIAFIMLLPIGAAVVVAFMSSLMQNGVVVSSEPLIPKLEKISILKGLKRLFSLRSVMEFLKGILKLSIVAAVGYFVVASESQRLENLVDFSPQDILTLLAALAFKLVLGAAAVMAVIAMADYLYQRFEYLKSLRMTRQELKDEFKQTEGDPQIKSKLRQIRRERAQQRMMAAVPDADVVIRNPTHFAVALKYDDKTMPAPIVVAMGQDHIALKIIELAETLEIPVVTNKPLARALFDSTEIDMEIPIEHYQAVAEVISYVYRLKGKNRPNAA